MPNKLYIITGADGYLGRIIASELLDRGCRVRGLVHRQKLNYARPNGMQTVVGDVCDPSVMERLFDGVAPDTAVVIHTAAVISVKKRDKLCMHVNVDGTKNLIAACLRYRVYKLIYIGSVDALPQAPSGSVVTEPVQYSPDGLPTSYGRSKAIAAQAVLDAVKEHGLDATILLPACIIGPGDYRRGFVTQMLEIYLHGIPRVSVDGGYEFVDARDVASTALSAVTRGGRGESYILSNCFMSVTDVFDVLACCTGRKPTRVTLSLWLIYPIAPLVDIGYRLVGKQPPLTVNALRLMAAHPAYSHEKAMRELGFSPRPERDSLKDAAEFILNRKELRSIHKG